MNTKKLICLWVIAAMMTLTALAADPVGTIVSISGKASATAKDGAVRILALKSPVMLNDKIKTETGASLQIMFLDDSVLSQGEKSEMTVDEYVYNPQKKEENSCTLRLGKGLFRAVTARITALNPDRFKVKTKLATIGVRGCEVAFTLTQGSENVYVLGLPDGKSITVTLNPDAISGLHVGGTVNENTAIEILRAGTMVSIREGEGLSQRPISNQDAINLIQQITSPGGTGNSPANSGGNGGTAGSGNSGLNDVTGASSQNNHQQALQQTGNQTVTDLQNSQTTTTTTTPTTTPTTTQPPAASPASQYTKMGPAAGPADWEWGVWAVPGQSPDSVVFKGNSIIADADVAALYVGGIFNLQGTGDSAAIITHGGQNTYVSGSCTLNVSIGNAAGSWSAQSALNGSGASLNYNITGTIDASGVLHGSIVGTTDYLLTIGGSNYTTPETQTIHANLTGAGAINPPTGIFGNFTFTHDGGATTVRGGFGSNLSPAAY